MIGKIFDPYFSTKEMGSGLGLAICHSIISKHGGAISVQSEEGKGTQFTLYLPASPQPASPPIEAKQKVNGIATRARILFMDDEPIVRMMAGHMLTQAGHEVIMANDGEEAIRLYRKSLEEDRPIDLLIMDLIIAGGMGGKETVQEILRLNPAAKAVVQSGYSNDPILAHCRDYGFKASLAKPFQYAELNEVIQTVLG